jgi:NAD(P)-dependent dehydrogenase (short-subunit alcohol dehydrogenase family)
VGWAEGKVALVTGGASGIGAASCRQLAEAGARVAVVDLDNDAATELAKSIDGIAVTADVSTPEGAQSMVDATVQDLGRLDIAVNNAGRSGAPYGIADHPIDEWDATIAINLRSVFLSMKFEVPALLKAGGGAIVNTASGAGLVGFAALPAYVASKHGVVGLTKSAALELAPAGIRVNCVCPGTTRTTMLEGFIGGDVKLERMMTASTPLRRMATPDEIAASIVWLCSPAASFVIGAALPVDGGAVAQ